MDNLTHTLIGLAAGEAVARCTLARPNGLPDPSRRTTLLAMGMLGGNLPDVDLLWSMEFLTGDSIDYLVQHRGHTHTLVGCAVLALLLMLSVLAALRWRRRPLCRFDFGLLAFMALLSVTLHLGMDALNAYGVHPFWPWNGDWFYGDTLFIVEPLFWLVTAPLLLGLRSRWARALLMTVLVVGCAAILAYHRFSIVWWTVPVLVIVLILASRRLSPQMAAVVSCTLAGLVVGVFSMSQAAASQRVEATAALQFPEFKTLDIVLSPAPSHPFCWDVILLQRTQHDYVARVGQLSLTSDSNAACARILGAQGTAPLVPMNIPVTSGMRWMREFAMEIEPLARLAASNCDTRRATSFLRAPFAVETNKGWILGDLRYDREPEPGFAEVEVDLRHLARCAMTIPWIAPRRDLGL